jgi:hypothetical protein
MLSGYTLVSLNGRATARSTQEATVTETTATQTVEIDESAPYSWTLTGAELAATQAKLAKINERAAKRGWAGRVDVDVTEREYAYKNDLGFQITEILYDVTMTGEAPCYEGWTFAATLDWDQHAGLIVRTAPGVEGINRESLREGWCDHCQKIRNRNKTMLVRHAETGEQKQIGSTCIKDFLGWDARPVFIYADEISDDIDSAVNGVGRDRSYTVETVLSLAWACTMAYGFVPRSSFNGQPTADAVNYILDPPSTNAKTRERVAQMKADLAPYIADAAAKATEVRTWIASDEFSGASEYVLNMKAVAAAEHVSPRNIGLLASAPQAWAKAQAATLVRKAKDETPSEWFGTAADREKGIKGSKETFTGVIESIRWIAGDFGSITLYTLRNAEDGRIAKWFASSAVLGEKEGLTVTITGTVKKHEEYQGIKSTVLTRCKLVD